MWQRLSLQARLSLPMVAMVLAALALGAVALQVVSPQQFEYENAQGSRSTKAVADALNAALAASANPRATLEAFGHGLGSSEAIRFQNAGASPLEPRVHLSEETVPRWFIALLRVPQIGAVYPVIIGTDHVGDIVFSPDLSADIFEKWIGFLAIVVSGSTLMLFAALSAYLTSGSAVRPLGQLAEGLTRLRKGDYKTITPLAGPPEIRKSCEEANQLARTLKGLSQQNRDLLRKVVSVQDDERRELARELHDELGPLLFAIRANATALSESAPSGDTHLVSFIENILKAAETMQQANRRMLEGLSPFYVGELGLAQSIQTLLRNARTQAPDLKLAVTIDSRLNEIDGVLSQTIYRVIQESMTNVLRHARASQLVVKATLGDKKITIEISDDGIGLPSENAFGRGLTGMNERVRALDGTLELLREDGRTLVRCRLPREHEISSQGGALRAKLARSASA
jgi:signal transduction histidine kinase